jgi:hypothetical protein
MLQALGKGELDAFDTRDLKEAKVLLKELAS